MALSVEQRDQIVQDAISEISHIATLPEVTIREQPSYGTVMVQPVTVPLDASTNCAGSRVTGPALVYTPRKGFRGTDRFTIDFPFASNESRPATMTTAATVPNSWVCGMLSMNPATRPAIKFPSAEPMNHVPIIWPTRRSGASFVTLLSPTGLRHNSPTVCRK